MEGQLMWKDEYNIGVDIIDREHRRLFKIINKLSMGMQGRDQVLQGSRDETFYGGRRIYGVY